jgi:hypothetical protein
MSSSLFPSTPRRVAHGGIKKSKPTATTTKPMRDAGINEYYQRGERLHAEAKELAEEPKTVDPDSATKDVFDGITEGKFCERSCPLTASHVQRYLEEFANCGNHTIEEEAKEALFSIFMEIDMLRTLYLHLEGSIESGFSIAEKAALLIRENQFTDDVALMQKVEDVDSIKAAVARNSDYVQRIFWGVLNKLAKSDLGSIFIPSTVLLLLFEDMENFVDDDHVKDGLGIFYAGLGCKVLTPCTNAKGQEGYLLEPRADE